MSETAQPTTDVQVAAPAEVAQPIQEAQQPIQAAAETVPPVETPAPASEPAAPQDPWQSITVKDVAQRFKDNRNDLLKEYGLDEFTLGLIEYREKTGDVTPYLEAKSVDWTKVADEKVLESKLREQYSKHNLPEADVQLLIQREMRNKYLAGEADDPESEDVKFARLQLKIDANEERARRIENQKQFRAPERPQPPPEVSLEQQVAQAREQILKDAAVQQFLQGKKLSFGEEQSPYNFEVPNAEKSVELLYNPERWNETIGKLTAPERLKLVTYIENMQAVEKNLIAYGRTLGEKKAVTESENIQDNKTAGADAPEESFWKQWKSNMKYTS